MGKTLKAIEKIYNARHGQTLKNGIDLDLVKRDASNLLLASISDNMNKKDCEHKNVFHEIFTKRSFNHLYFVAIQFEKSSVAKSSLYTVVKNVYKATKDKMFFAIGAILLWLTRRDEFYANLFGNAVYRHGPSYCMFLRIIVERHGIDLKNIIDKYGRMALQKWIRYDFGKKDADAALLVKILCGLQTH